MRLAPTREKLCVAWIEGINKAERMSHEMGALHLKGLAPSPVSRGHFFSKSHHMSISKEILDRLEYCEETFAGEIETWHDPVTDTYYHVPIEIVRDFTNIEKL